MFSEKKYEERIWKGRWPVIALVVVVGLAALQMLRVNQPKEESVEDAPAVQYTDNGPLLTGNLWIDPNAFHSIRIDLNRKAKLAGTFHTPSSKQRVAILVVDEPNFEKWKARAEFRPIVTTGAVPGGRIAPVFGPGTFFLIIDNRANDKKQAVETDFTLE